MKLLVDSEPQTNGFSVLTRKTERLRRRRPGEERPREGLVQKEDDRLQKEEVG